MFYLIIQYSNLFPPNRFGDIQLGDVFKSMLADRISDLSNVGILMKNKPFYVETKYDGERMQVYQLSPHPQRTFQIETVLI